MYRAWLIIPAVVLIVSGCNSSSSGPGADTQAPVVTITSHADGDTFTAAYNVTISGDVSDNTAVDSMTVSVNGGSATPVNYSNGSFSINLDFSSDTNEVVVTAADAAGNSGSATVNLYYVATGLLDTGFNTVGYSVFPDLGSHDSANGVRIASDGSFYLAGYARNVTGTGYDIAVWHLLADGTADTSFDGDGVAVLAGPAGGTGHDFANGLAIDANGKIVVVGHSINASGDDDMVLARFNTNGSLDTSFGGDVNPADGTPDGFVVVDVSGAGSADSGSAVVIDSSGNIYVAGTTDAAGDNDLTLWKFSSAGVLDTSFNGGAGYISYDSGGADTANALTMDANGNLLIAGDASGKMAIWRVTSTGVSDTAFNGTGVATLVAGLGAVGNAITTDASGNIVVAGTVTQGAGNTDMILWRCTNSGTTDTSFAAPNGYVTHDGAGLNSSNDYDYGYDVAIDAAGNLLVSGSTTANHSGQVKLDMVVWRFTNDGVLDNTFGDDVNPADGTPDGFFTHNSAAGGNNQDDGKAIAIDSLGRIVVGGDSSNATVNSDMAIWRLY